MTVLWDHNGVGGTKMSRITEKGSGRRVGNGGDMAGKEK